MEPKQHGSVWCVLAAVLFIQHIILMSVTPTTFWAGQSSVITEALLLVLPNLKLVSRAPHWPLPYKHLSQRPPFTDVHQKCHQITVDSDLNSFWLKYAVVSFVSNESLVFKQPINWITCSKEVLLCSSLHGDIAQCNEVYYLLMKVLGHFWKSINY